MQRSFDESDGLTWRAEKFNRMGRRQKKESKKKKKFPQFNTFILFWDSLSAFCYTRVYKGSEGMGKRDFQPNRVINICKDLPSLCKKIIFSRSLCAL